MLLVEHDEQPYVVMKTITESIGLSWQGQHEKLVEHFGKGIKEILIPTNGGLQLMICMNLRKFPAWLYSLQPKKVSDPIKRAKIISFKEECDYISGYVESEWKT
ncbi:phage antirepressor N-terminal domain-containing protein, partial [Glaesserella parasuis]